MGRTAFSENYSVCLKEDGSPREISRSGAVVTYKAIGYDSGQAVALQLIPVTSLDSPVRARFEEQARTVQKLQHVNVARVLDFGVEDDHIVFRSEIFSLGATMCFVLTGAVPLAGVPDESGIAERVLPPGNAIPRSIRQLLVRMLRHKPEERPQDPVAFAEEMRASLQKIERKTAFTRRFG